MAINPAAAHYRPEVHGHRGCRGLFPENTIPSFLHALELGVDVLEMDVVISADGKVVVSHEPWLNPSICLDPAGLVVKPDDLARFNLYQMPYHLIRQCDCGLLQHPNFPLQQNPPAYKPLLSEVLRVVASTSKHLDREPVRFSIEIKSLPEGDHLFHPAPDRFLDLVLAELTAAKVISQSTLLCFDARILQLVHYQEPALATCLLVEEGQPWLPSLHALGFVPTTFGPNCCTVTDVAVGQLRASFPGLRLVPWTANTLVDMQHLIEVQVEGITTDYPDMLIALLEKRV
jgi:glycerophosphoryl diester phosphodiesterase